MLNSIHNQDPEEGDALFVDHSGGQQSNIKQSSLHLHLIPKNLQTPLDIIIFTPFPKYLVVDVDNFYLDNPFLRHEYSQIALSLIPYDIINNYYLMDKQICGFIYVRL